MYHYMNSANVEIPLLQNLFFAIVFALSITIFHVYKQIREVKKLHGGSLSAEDFWMCQTLNLQLPLTKDQIVARLKNTFPSKNWEIAEEADEELKLKNHLQLEIIWRESIDKS